MRDKHNRTVWVGRNLQVYLAATAFALTIGIIGCSHKDSVAPAAQTQSFDSAGPEIKAAWETAVSAAQTNAYSTAILTLRTMQARTDLSDEQRAAVDDLMTSVNNRVSEAAAKGDASAKQALDEIRENWRKSQMHR